MPTHAPRFDSPPEFVAGLRRICQTYRVRELALFGSALTERFNAASDIDLLVDFAPETRVGFLLLSRMQRELADLFHRPVDLVPKDGLKPLIRDSVLSQARVLYAN
ncbi:MAG: nucleotidyltransferase domain-containing protein [Sulfuritalea sp.]|nr:nucleotidyltransferase domain-containing protein [Sulfuritalea sp.]